VLRVAGGVFYGLGDLPAEDAETAREASEEKTETEQGRQPVPLTMILPPALLAAAAVVAGLLPHLGPAVQHAAVRFQDQAGYGNAVLFGQPVTHPAALYPAESTGVTLAYVLNGAGSAAGALILAGLALYRRRIPVLRHGPEPDLPLAGPIRRFQSGVVNDYVTWIVIGLTGVGAVLAFTIR